MSDKRQTFHDWQTSFNKREDIQDMDDILYELWKTTQQLIRAKQMLLATPISEELLNKCLEEE